MKVTKCLISIVLSLALLGCATTYPSRIPCPITKNLKIGVFSLMDGSAVQIGSPNFLVSLVVLGRLQTMGDFDYDKILDYALTAKLEDHGYQFVSPITVSRQQHPFADLGFTMGGLTDYEGDSINYVKKNITPGAYDYIVLIVPDRVDCGGSAYTTMHFRYGISFKQICRKPYFFAAYQILIIDGKSYKIIASDNSEIVHYVQDNILTDSLSKDPVGMAAFQGWLKTTVTRSVVYKALRMINTNNI